MGLFHGFYAEGRKEEHNSDDLQLTVNLVSGNSILIPVNGRIRFDKECNLVIELPINVTPKEQPEEEINSHVKEQLKKPEFVKLMKKMFKDEL